MLFRSDFRLDIDNDDDLRSVLEAEGREYWARVYQGTGMTKELEEAVESYAGDENRLWRKTLKQFGYKYDTVWDKCEAAEKQLEADISNYASKAKTILAARAGQKRADGKLTMSAMGATSGKARTWEDLEPAQRSAIVEAANAYNKDAAAWNATSKSLDRIALRIKIGRAHV